MNNINAPAEVSDHLISRRIIDSHHSNVEYGWYEKAGQLYQRQDKVGRWKIVHRIHVTPHRIGMLHCLINNT